MTVHIGIIGISGRMGKEVLSCLLSDSSFSLSSAIVSPNSTWIGKDAGETIEGKKTGVLISAQRNFFSPTDVLIDFSSPKATLENISSALFHKLPIVIGTTGLQPDTLSFLENASNHIPILYSANFSLGMAACIEVAKQLSTFLSPRFSRHIQETHHKHKKDSPSGTALALAKSMESSFSQSIPIISRREGEVVGEHKVLFCGEHETIELCHSATSRVAFAQGALSAAQFLFQKPPGLYSLKNLFS